MYNLIYFRILFFILCTEDHLSFAKLALKNYEVRCPKRNDIGLIFDLTICNDDKEKKEMLEFRIVSDGNCQLNLPNNEIMKDASSLVGGFFGSINAGATQIVSLIWPTISHFNRVGCCSVDIVSIDANKQTTHLKNRLPFDTRFETLDPQSHTLRKLKDFMDCGNNFDLDNFKNCAPVDCEERYFGRRSYFNKTIKQCQAVPRCVGARQSYNIWQNECVDAGHFCSDADIQKIRKGQFKILNNKKLNCMSNAKSNEHDKQQNCNTQNGTKQNCKRDTENAYTNISSYQMPAWIRGIGSGLLIVVATLLIYLSVCFIIFLVVNWISRRQLWCSTIPTSPEHGKVKKSKSNKKLKKIRSKSKSPENTHSKIVTRSSLLSIR